MSFSQRRPSLGLLCCCLATAALVACGIDATQAPGSAASPPPPLPPGAAAADRPAPESHAPLRIWIDEFFFAEGETALLREAVAAAGSEAAVVAGETRNRVFQLKSYQQAARADVFWTGQLACYQAFKRQLNASHAVSCVPGSQAITEKASLVASLEAAYGPAAWGIVPRSFHLPRQFGALAAHLKQEQRSGRGGGLWVLKEDVHRGKGVGVVTPPQALARALQRAPAAAGPGGGAGGGLKHVLAQRFLGEQFLVAGRPFYIRLWAVLMGADPARAYLWDGGVVVFGQEQQQQGQQGQQQQGQQQQQGPRQVSQGSSVPASSRGAAAVAAGEALIVNLWTQDRSAAAPWSLGQLESHLAAQAGSSSGADSGQGSGAETVARLRRGLHTAVAAALAAGLPSVRRTAAALPGFQGGSFEVLGVDFLLDASLKPWLVEVNQLPSMARKLVGCNASSSGGGGSGSAGDNASSGRSDSRASSHSSSGAGDACQSDNPFDVQKERFVRGLLGLLSERHRQLPRLAQQAQQALHAAAQAAAAGGPAPCIDASQLQQLLAARAEQAAAERLGFVPLTGLMHRCLACMAQAPAVQNGSSSSSSSSACDVLAELTQQGRSEQQKGGQCKAPAAGSERLAARLRHWADRLLLEAASLAPWLLNPAARWQVTRKASPAAAAPPARLSESDARTLAWLEGGGAPLDSAQALHAFCAASWDAA